MTVLGRHSIQGAVPVKQFISLFFALIALVGLPHTGSSQALPSPSPAAESVQESGSSAPLLSPPQSNKLPLKIPAGTPIEIEATHTVNSVDVKAGELVSFRVLIPVVLDGVTVIEKGALVTALVTVAKRGGHWGKSGRLAWRMQDVIAVDNTRIPLAPESSIRNPEWILLKEGRNKRDSAAGQTSVKGTSHKGEVATRTIIAAAIFPPLAPLALMHGFRRGENAVLPEGKRFIVVVRGGSSNIAPPRTDRP